MRMNQAQFARRWDCSPQYISKLAMAGVLPKVERMIDVEPADAIMQQIADDRIASPDYNKERARHEQLKADLAELELKKQRGELVEIEQVKRDWIKKIVACRGKLLSLPSKVAPRFPLCDTSQEMEEVLKDGIVEALGELAEY